METAPARSAGRSTPLLGTAYAGLAVLDTALATRGTPSARRLRRVTKPALMPVLMGAFATRTAPVTAGSVSSGSSVSPGSSGSTGRGRRGVLAAQALSGIGDTALLGSGRGWFVTGLSGFLAAHVAYVGAFARLGRPLDDPPGRRGAITALGAGAALGPVMGWAAGREDPRLRAPVTAYGMVLCSMVATSVRVGPTADERARRLVRTGTALFLASDTVLGAREFLVRDPSPLVRAALDGTVMATYTAAQGLIAAGMARSISGQRARGGAGPR